jgi:sugar/nucleoside kinase (ribokinase family)
LRPVCDVIAFGEISFDTLILIGERAEADGKTRALSLVDAPGGQAATFAVGCRRLGWRTRVIGVIGDDSGGASTRAALEHEGVDPMLVMRPGIPTRRAVIEVDGASGDRRVFSHRDSRLNLSPGEIPDPFFTDASLLMVDATDATTARRAAAVARAAGVTTLVDVDEPTDGARSLLREIELIVLPADVVAPMSGRADLGAGLAVLAHNTGASLVVATLGAAGAVALTSAGEFRATPPAVDVVDTTGAGDAFRAGLAAGWLAAARRGESRPDWQQILDDAVLVAALNCRALGAQTALPARSAVPERLWGPL